MSRISLKTDYEDGKVLNAGELNVNNNVTMLGVNDNFERINRLGNQKADIVYVDNKISGKADLSVLNSSLRELNLIKADKSELVTKANKSEVDSKANLTYVNEQLATKANLSYVTAQLNSKVNVDDLEDSLNLKADKTTIGNLSSLKTDDKSSIVNAINSINLEATPIATLDKVGLVKPDGTTTTIDADGTIHAVGGGGGGSGTSDYEALSNKPLINDVELKGNVSLEDLNLMDKDTLEEALNSKANSNNVYSRNYIDTNVVSVLNAKADSSSVDAALALKANASEVYSKSTVNELLEAQVSSYDAKLLAKANITDTYTKSETNELVNTKADGLFFNENQLQLKSDGELIGNPVTIEVATSDIVISEEEPTGEDWKIWIPSNEVENISEVIDSLDGDYKNLAPSVRAVKEENTIVKVESSDIITLNSGFSILENSVFKQGKHYFGYLTIGKSSKFTTDQEEVGRLNHSSNFAYNIYGISGTSVNDRWAIPTNFAYVYIHSDGKMLIRGKSTDEYIKMYLDIVEQ